MAFIKRSVVVIAGGVLAALTACAPTPANSPNNEVGAAPVANQAVKPSDPPSPKASPPPAPPADVDVTEQLIGRQVARMGQVVTDEQGWILYRFDRDSANPPTSNCVDRCAEVWPPALTDGTPGLRGVAADKVGTVTRQNGTKQITIGGWPVYRYIGDKKPGQWKGQGVSGTWFVVTPTGAKNLSCLPKGTPTPVEPPSGAGQGGAGDTGY